MKTTLQKLFIPQPKSKIKAGEGLESGDYRFFTSSSIQSKFLNYFQYDKEALIFGTGGNASVHYCNEPFSTSTDCIVVYGNETVSLKMVYYYLSGQMDLLKNGFKGAGLQHISKDYILNIPIDLPNRAAQDEIVKTFDKIEQIIGILNAKLALLDKIVKSRFVEMFGDPAGNPKGWTTLSFKQAGVRLSDGPFGSNLKSEHYTTEGVRVIRLGNIGVGCFIDKDKSFVSIEHYERLKKYTCKAGEIVIGTLGEPNLRACIIPENVGYAINKADCVHYIPKAEILDSRFVCQYINCPETLHLAAGMIHGQTRSRISSGQIAEMPIFIPPIELQNQFAALVHKIDKSKLAVKECLKKAKYLKSALMQEYFG